MITILKLQFKQINALITMHSLPLHFIIYDTYTEIIFFYKKFN